jgi:AraC-like DNA-binding protein
MPLAIPLKKPKKEPITTPTSIDPLAETAQVIVDYIETEKSFLNPDFDVEELSEKLQIPKHHIIYCFTIILQKKFTAYRSTMRVEHAKELLKQGSANTLSIDGIGYQSGFPSRSSFFATFKAETGMTPNQYLETINE